MHKLGERVAENPLDQGFSYHRGAMFNLDSTLGTGNTPRGYWQWERVEDGVPEWNYDYNISVTTDDALELAGLLPEPWLLYVACNSAHEPLHRPPDHLLFDPEAVSEDSEDLLLYQAMVTATDLEIGRLLTSIDEDLLQDTLVLYLSDNGSPKWGITAPLDPARGKGTAYEGGVRVPFIAAGAGVMVGGSDSHALVSFSDIFPTLAELVGVDLATWTPPSSDADAPLALDGESLVGIFEDPAVDTQREHVMAEAFQPPGGGPYSWTRRTLVTDEWKYVRLEGEESTGEAGVDAREELYRLVETVPDLDLWALDEGPDLVAAGTLDDEAQAAFDVLSAAMDETLARRPFEY